MIGGDLLKPYNSGGHAAYQERILTQLLQYYPNADTSLSSSTWEIMEQFWSLDLSHVDDMMQDRYSVFGPEPRLPSNMLRSYLLSIKYKVTSITAWASDLKQNHLHAILSGFTVRDTPGVSTFYDFFDRLWFSDKNNISDPVYPPKQKPKKPDKKGIRDCNCDRIYLQPDCDIGYDSHRERYYFGNDLYMLTASDSENDLPVFPRLGPASRHDSHGFWYNFFSMQQFLLEAKVKKLLLDSAHDAMAYYQYCMEHFIDLNGKGGRPPVYKDDFTIGDDGIPSVKRASVCVWMVQNPKKA